MSVELTFPTPGIPFSQDMKRSSLKLRKRQRGGEGWWERGDGLSGSGSGGFATTTWGGGFDSLLLFVGFFLGVGAEG